MSEHSVMLNHPASLMQALEEENEHCYFYTSHQIYWDGVIKQSRSSPNWEGGMVTYATCKHHMRSTSRPWEDTWIATCGPRDCEDNTMIMVGKIRRAFTCNYALTDYLKRRCPEVYKVKRACTNPRGDLYDSKKPLKGSQVHHHEHFIEPPNHTRSVDFYKKSPGSTSTREDGLIPKWWRDIEYYMHKRRPPVFIMAPCWIFSRPMLWSELDPKRASLSLTTWEFLESLNE